MVRTCFLIPALITSCMFISCKKDAEIKPSGSDTPVPVTPVDSAGLGQVAFDFKAFVNGVPLIGNSAWYTNANGDSFTVSKFNYYFTNIIFKKSDGTSFVEKESYYLNKHLSGKETFTVTGIPTGTYTSIDFLIGVDSYRNVSGVQTGALDVKEDMFWDWNTGYIFLKLEGDYKTVNVTDPASYAIHVGGFSGKDNNIEHAVLTFNTPLIIKKDKISKLFFHTNIDEIFKTPTVIGLEEFSVVTTKTGKIVSTNYRDMFEIYKIEN